MNAERRKVLDMLAAGKITPDDAEQLLRRLDPDDAEQAPPGFEADGDDVVDGKARAKKLRYLRVFVEKPDHDNVNIRMPLKLVMTGIKLSALVPGKAGMHLSDRNIDLSYLGKLKGNELDKALAELDIDIETDKGNKVRVFCE